MYCAKYWITYAAVAESNHERLRSFIKEFFCNHKSSSRNCYRLYRPDQPWYHELADRGKEPDSALYYASFGGLVNAVKHLLGQGADVNAQSGFYSTAVQAASFEDHEKIVEMLLSKGADVNAQGGFYGTVLYAASFEGHEKIVELLLSKGADVNAQGRLYGTALQAALVGGHEKIVQPLLEQGADINAQGGKYVTQRLLEKGSGGRNQTVQLLGGRRQHPWKRIRQRVAGS